MFGLSVTSFQSAKVKKCKGVNNKTGHTQTGTKGPIISEGNRGVQKANKIILRISALASKKRSNQ